MFAAAQGTAEEGYVLLGGERIFVRVEPEPRAMGRRHYGCIVLAEAPPLYGNGASTPGRKWRAS